MFRYGKIGHGGFFDNDLELTELYPVIAEIKNFSAGEKFNFYTQYCYSAIILDAGSLRINSRAFSSTLSSGQLIIADPFSPCHMYAVTDVTLATVRFSGKRATDFSSFCATIYPSEGMYGELSQLMSRNDLHDIFLVSFLYKLYGVLGVHKNHGTKAEALNRYVKMAIDNINNSYLSQTYSLEVLSADMHITPSYLSRLFKKEVGITMQEYLKNRRLEAGYQLLLQGYKVKDAAEKCGIKHVNNFSEMFYRRYGIRPSEVKSE